MGTLLLGADDLPLRVGDHVYHLGLRLYGEVAELDFACGQVRLHDHAEMLNAHRLEHISFTTTA